MNTSGFPSPAQGYEEKALDFNSLIIKNPSSTFTLRYKGKSLEDFNVMNNDLLIVDCSKKPSLNSLIIVRTIDGFECHPIISIKNDSEQKVFIYRDNNLKEQICCEIFGVVSAVLRVY